MMLIDVCIGCGPDNRTDRSECSLLIESLTMFRDSLEQNPDPYGDVGDYMLIQVNNLLESVHDAMLRALEGLEQRRMSDDNGGHKDVYAVRSKAGEGPVE